MVITEEIIAAYIEGNVTAEERAEVRTYLARHPETQDLVLALMDDSILDEDVEEKTDNTLTLNTEQTFTDISYAAAAFAPKITMGSKATQESIENHISQRQKRMIEFWSELEKEV